MRRTVLVAPAGHSVVRRLALAVGSVALLAGAGCASRPAEPVGGLALGSRSIRLVYPECTAVHFAWTPSTALAGVHGQPRVFVHLLIPPRRLVRTFDHDLPQPWEPGNAQGYDLDLCQSALAERLAPGRYDLAAGLIDATTGRRYPLRTAGEDLGNDEYRLATVDVDMVRGNAPHFEFSPAWHASEPGTDKQVLARRWLYGAGALALTGITAAGELRLDLRVPLPGPSAVRVTSGCGGGGDATIGPGLARLEVPVAADLRDGACELRFAPSPAAWTEPDARALGVEGLAWKPAPR